MKSILISILFIGCFTLVGCNTVKGFGQDLSAGGHALSNAAQNAN
ncbi:MAG: entericidin A/B family lipoprotein [Legionellales bacterium]|nr:entericidin A/B family lipoprotein [Legionellales bacterium]